MTEFKPDYKLLKYGAFVLFICFVAFEYLIFKL